ncbi:MAG: GAF domain-containing protein [Deltaproteobacteria bacterium]|nr:GAF domain-containing protein [Deltaproteobacteria bacterium]
MSMVTELEQAQARLTSLIEMNQLLVSTVEPEELLHVILAAAIRLFAVEGCSIGLVDAPAQQLAFTAMEGKAKVDEFRIALDQGIAGWVARTGKEVFSNNASQDPRFFGGVDKKTGFQTKSVMCAPLKQYDRVIGVLEALNTTNPKGFTDADLQLFLAFASLAVTALSRAKAFASVRNVNAVFQETVQGRYRLVTGSRAAMRETLRLARAAAVTPTTVLLLGDSGTGKEVVARSIHEWSPRAEQPFIAVNCTALTAELLESELFGHEKGAFTGATAQKKGKFELADSGTIFLDEIGDLAPNLQVKLLRVLQDKEFQRVGGVKDLRVDVRILAATNRDLLHAMRKGTFREDLYYRLNVVALTLPALRERCEDIPALVQHFIEHYCREMNHVPMTITSEALTCLQHYTWPGNVRELQNVIERAVVLSQGPCITVDDLPREVTGHGKAQSPSTVQIDDIDESLSLSVAIDEFTRRRISSALLASGGNQTEAARQLQLPQSNLSRIMKRLGMR